MARYEGTGVRRYFRADAAFASPEVKGSLKEGKVLYAMRFPSNEVLEREVRHLMKRPVGRPPGKPIIRYHDWCAWRWARAMRMSRLAGHRSPRGCPRAPCLFRAEPM